MAPSSHRKSPTVGAATEADIATNCALLHYSEASRQAKSWLSGFTSANGQEDHETDQEEEAERELLKKQDLFSETGGIGYLAPESLNGSSRPAMTDPTTTFLRRQLLSGRAGVKNGLNGHNATATRPRHQAQRFAKHDQDADEEESRASVGKKRGRGGGKSMKTVSAADQIQAADLTAHPAAISLPGTTEKSPDSNGPKPTQQSSSAAGQPEPGKKRRTSSYLDELLASRAAKKQKKTKPNNNAR